MADDWTRVDDVLQSVLLRPPGERDAFLRQACGGDSALEREVRSLLAADEQAGSFLDDPAIHAAARAVADDQRAGEARRTDLLETAGMALSPGSRLGPYEISAQIGAGGMGEVYRALDTNLGRPVAIKVLPEAVAADRDRLARFDREARTLAALNHPNIAAIYGLERSGGTTALVMELVEGLTLADRIMHGPVPVEEALSIAKQIAEALEAAHEHGIVHRDLKPANIKLRPDGTVKVLDFGLAKAVGPAAGSLRGVSQAATKSTPAATEAGIIVGTAAYMSPEQARGANVDKRADIWAFGVVLYEMVTGRPLFTGETTADILVAILKEAPDLTVLPEQIRPLVARCLQKDPKNRLRDIGDMELVLGQAAALPISRARGLRQWVWMATTAVLMLGLAAISFVYFRKTPQPALLAPTTATTIVTPKGTTVLQGFAISPDARFLAMAPEINGKRQLWLRPMDADRPQPIPNTENAVQPFWSPDGRNIAFFADGKLKRVAVTGGLAQSLCEAPYPYGGSWSSEGVIVFSRNYGTSIQRVAASGGTPVDVTGTEGDVRYPVFLPDGRRFLYVARGGTAENSGTFVGSLDGAENRRILPDVSPVLFAPPTERDRIGQLLFIRENTLMAAPFDGASAQIVGDALPVAQGATSPTVSHNGMLLYFTRADQTSSGNQIGWYDRAGKFLGPISASGLQPAISHDEKSVAFSRRTNGKLEIWVHDVNSGRETPITDISPSQAPFWSPQDDRIVFVSNQTGGAKLYQRLSNGSGQDELVRLPSKSPWPSQWSRDGKYIVYFEAGSSKNRRDIWVLPTEGNRNPIPFLTTEADEFMGQLSPDSHWMAFTSDRSGQPEVYVRPFPSGEGQWQISVSGGRAPRWRVDGKELYFIAADGELTEVPVKRMEPGAKPSFEAGIPVQLFDAHVASPGNDTLFQYDVTWDGRRFVINASTPGVESALVLTVVTNWAAGLRK